MDVLERINGARAREWAREGVRGQWYAPMGAVTPDNQVDEDGLRTIVRHGLRLNVGGMAYSSLMEPWSSTHEERRRGLEVFMDELAGRLPVYVNITDHSIEETVLFGQHALEQPGQVILLLECPYEHAKSDDLVVEFFHYVTERLDGPFAIYNTPHAGMILSPELIARLCEIESICAIKNAINDPVHSKELFRLVGDQIVVSNPAEKTYLQHILEDGQAALFSTTATHLMQTPDWQPVNEYEELARAGRVDEAQAIRDEIEPLRALWEQVYSVLWGAPGQKVQHPIAYAKYWQELLGVPAGDPRPPLAKLSDEEKTKFRRDLKATGFAERLGLDL